MRSSRELVVVLALLISSVALPSFVAWGAAKFLPKNEDPFAAPKWIFSKEEVKRVHEIHLHQIRASAARINKATTVNESRLREENDELEESYAVAADKLIESISKRVKLDPSPP